MTFTKSSVLIAVIGCALFGNAFAQDLDNENLGRMRDAARSYADAWLTNDADTVMATFVDEPVLSVGTLDYFLWQDSACAFWFPAANHPSHLG